MPVRIRERFLAHHSHQSYIEKVTHPKSHLVYKKEDRLFPMRYETHRHPSLKDV